MQNSNPCKSLRPIPANSLESIRCAGKPIQNRPYKIRLHKTNDKGRSVRSRKRITSIPNELARKLKNNHDPYQRVPKLFNKTL